MKHRWLWLVALVALMFVLMAAGCQSRAPAAEAPAPRAEPAKAAAVPAARSNLDTGVRSQPAKPAQSSEPAPAVEQGGDEGETLAGAFQKGGCGACHVIPGVANAAGAIGPDLSMMSETAQGRASSSLSTSRLSTPTSTSPTPAPAGRAPRA
ncbi:MAG: hypothetical protein MUC34_20195 [Anaerolineae bacterium]|nr:hypothetical protein [Anaerolineae bacterium]